MGAVSTTTIAGVFAIRRGLAKPIGSLTQMGAIRLGKRTEGRSPLIKDFVPLASLDDIVFGGWDIFEENAYEAAKTLPPSPPAAIAACSMVSMAGVVTPGARPLRFSHSSATS